MRTLLFCALLLSGFAPAPAGFEIVDVYIDAGERPLAAYQVEILYPEGTRQIVGIENGGGTFAAPPEYDSVALLRGRVIVAAYTLENVPAGRVRVARIHLRKIQSDAVEYASKLMAAAVAGGEKIEARIELIPGGE